MICLPPSAILLSFCMRRENCVPAIPIKPPSLLPFFRLSLGGKIGLTNLAQQVLIPHNWEPPSPFSAVSEADAKH